jgi:hypothetical protein
MAGKKKWKKRLRDMRDRMDELEDTLENRLPAGPTMPTLTINFEEHHYYRVFALPQRQAATQVVTTSEAEDEAAADKHASSKERTPVPASAG